MPPSLIIDVRASKPELGIWELRTVLKVEQIQEVERKEKG